MSFFAATALSLSSLGAAQALTINSTVTETTSGEFRYEFSATAAPSSGDDSMRAVSLLFPILDASAIPGAGSLQSPLGWTASIEEAGASAWSYDTAVDPTFGLSPSDFETPVSVVRYTDETESTLSTNSSQLAAAFFDRAIKQASVDRALEKIDRLGSEVGPLQSRSLEINAQLALSVTERLRYQSALADVETLLGEISGLRDQLATVENELTELKFERDNLDPDDLGRIPLLIQINNKQDERDNLRSRISRAEQLLVEATELVESSEYGALLRERDAIDARLKAISGPFFNAQFFQLPEAEARLAEAEAEVARLVAERDKVQANSLTDGNTVPGFGFISALGPVLGPVQIGFSTSAGLSDGFTDADLPGTTTPVPLPAGGILILLGLGALGACRAVGRRPRL